MTQVTLGVVAKGGGGNEDGSLIRKHSDTPYWIIKWAPF
jgi:hypothetical protein